MPARSMAVVEDVVDNLRAAERARSDLITEEPHETKKPGQTAAARQ